MTTDTQATSNECTHSWSIPDSSGIRECFFCGLLEPLGTAVIYPSVAWALLQAERCRNYGPDHTRCENENVIVILADEVEKLTKGNQADAAPSGAGLAAPTPRGSLPNSLGSSPALLAETPPASNELSREEWLRRYRQRFVKVAGFTDAQADDATRAVCTGPDDEVGFIELSEGFENEPEAAADEEMSYWEGNGDE